MPKIVSSEELDSLVGLISDQPEGMSLAQILIGLDKPLSSRTLQRRLAMLVGHGRLVMEGASRTARYRRAPITGTGILVAQPATVQGTGEVYIPISHAGEEIKAYVRQPVQGRRPVGYERAFLDAYEPNQSSYLPGELRRQLRAMGTSPEAGAPAGTFARDILNRLLIDLSWSSSRLEGNTYSRLDTERLIAFGERAQGKDATEAQMILNHKAAIEYLVHDAAQHDLDGQAIKSLHALLSDGLMADPRSCGRLRDRVVEIRASVYRPVGLPQRVEEIFGTVIAKAGAIRDPLECAFFLMVHLPYLQPFEDVNKRVSRLAANHPLIRANLSPLSFIDVPEQPYVDGLLGIYELNRVELLRDVFTWAYERSCQQYVAVRGQMVPPDALRLKYRAALSECIRAIVRGGVPVRRDSIEGAIPSAVVPEDRMGFADMVLRELDALHAGNAVRFGLRPLELQGWKHGGNSEREGQGGA